MEPSLQQANSQTPVKISIFADLRRSKYLDFTILNERSPNHNFILKMELWA